MTATTCELSCDSGAPGRARRWLRGVLEAEHTPADEALVEDALLCVSELVTNAYQAGCTSVILRCRPRIDMVRLSVYDDAPGLPRRGPPPTPAEPRGRGLNMVDALARRWGVERPSRGKEVWVELTPDRSPVAGAG